MIRLRFLDLPAIAPVLGESLCELVLAVRTGPVKKLVSWNFSVIGNLRIVHFENPVGDALEMDHYPALLASPHLVLGGHFGETDHALGPDILFVLFPVLNLF